MKYPIGIQDFRELREGGYVYVDKTAHIHQMLAGGKYFFLSRPRRFGKSLLLSTIKELYAGSRELFEGLWIEDQWGWEQTNPVIWIKFSSQGVKTMGLEAALHKMLGEAAQGLGIELQESHYDQKLKELIARSATSRKVVLLIDEYD
ncbi:MAG: AAA family ATPase, partial [Phaeodactylibacter sp.]|nr:AAA family ATPase [Phaeodactylibacter sp.]